MGHISGKIYGNYKTTEILYLVDKLAISLFIILVHKKGKTTIQNTRQTENKTFN
jgi:hypothetical protein